MRKLPYGTLKERFESRYIPVPETGCWLWTAGALVRDGKDTYGLIAVNRVNRGAHRVSWELNRGPIPPGMCVCHKCDTPACVNPGHLFLGTHQDNIADKMAKGRDRVAFGEAQGHSKLTVAQVEAIRLDDRPQSAIAAEYGLGQQTVSKIKRGESWACAGGPIAKNPSILSGEMRRGAKLTEATVVAIRRDPRGPTAIARELGVTHALVGKIKRGISWPHVPMQ